MARNERCELQNFFAELISLMRPDHLTGDLFFPPFSFGPLVHAFARVQLRCTCMHRQRDISRELSSHCILVSYSEICKGEDHSIWRSLVRFRSSDRYIYIYNFFKEYLLFDMTRLIIMFRDRIGNARGLVIFEMRL